MYRAVVVVRRGTTDVEATNVPETNRTLRGPNRSKAQKDGNGSRQGYPVNRAICHPSPQNAVLPPRETAASLSETNSLLPGQILPRERRLLSSLHLRTRQDQPELCIKKIWSFVGAPHGDRLLVNQVQNGRWLENLACPRVHRVKMSLFGSFVGRTQLRRTNLRAKRV
jgi:hypothetical protein